MSYVDEQGRAIADEDIQAILDSKRKRIAELEYELALLRRQRVYDLDRCADAYKVTLKRLIAAKAEKPRMDEVLEAFQDSAKRYSELRKKLVETEQRYKAVCEGIMMAIDSSWRPNEARDWGRPELILGEYVGDLRDELAAALKLHHSILDAHDAAKDAEIAALSAGLHLAHEQMRAAGWQPDVIDCTVGLDSCNRALAEHDAKLIRLLAGSLVGVISHAKVRLESLVRLIGEKPEPHSMGFDKDTMEAL